jgi:hypothetical protein
MMNVRRISNSTTCTHCCTASDDEDRNNDPESQDEEDMGLGARPGGGFTSMVSFQPLENATELQNVVDILKGYCTVRPISISEEEVGP